MNSTDWGLSWGRGARGTQAELWDVPIRTPSPPSTRFIVGISPHSCRGLERGQALGEGWEGRRGAGDEGAGGGLWTQAVDPTFASRRLGDPPHTR